MRTTKQLSVTLPNEMAAQVRAKVESGEYASESEVIREGLRALAARDKAIEDWLARDVVEIYDAMRADPGARSAANVRSRLAAEHQRATKRRN